MAITIRKVGDDEIEEVVPVLVLAEDSESALRWSLANLSDTVYRMDEDGELVGAATLRLAKDPAEIMELAIVGGRQGRGLGKRFVDFLVNEARAQGKQELFVGTATASLNNIAFYQKCGFRMDYVRKDYFWYLKEPTFENGIPIRDMIVFRYEL